ncbi:hypothetical protein [Sulfobacillus harzensis]|uniref:DUF948 domain-containing protein n=1 Tax=Sulfobacillus harzensis TaxID=2729629 RepID=A0A7Y0L8Z4_9FIRM|nr:hypothetical protein [Sulfobacillus harzensis]NMP24705.1 hypothetical protein [Sulfobacillus harzensis]
MGNHADLTVMALSLAFLALMVILVLLVMLSLLLRIKSFEKKVENHLGDSRAVVKQIEQSGQRVTEAMDQVYQASRSAKSVIGVLRDTLSGKSRRTKSRWWIAAASLGWALWQRRRHKESGPSSTHKALPN